MAAIIAYLFYLSSSTASKLQRRHISLRRIDDEGQVDFAFRVMTITFLLCPVLLFYQRPHLSQSVVTVLLLGTVCGFFGALGWGFQYMSQRHTEAGVTSLLGNLHVLIDIALATVLLSESLGSRQLLGAGLLIVAAVLVSQKHRLSTWRFDRYFWMNAIAGLVTGFVLTAERSLIKENGITTGTLVSWGSQVIFLAAWALILGKRSQYDKTETLITGGLRFVQQFSWIVYVTIIANLSIGAVSATFSTTTVFITAAIFLHEREDLKRKIIGSVIATVGLIMMI